MIRPLIAPRVRRPSRQVRRLAVFLSVVGTVGVAHAETHAMPPRLGDLSGRQPDSTHRMIARVKEAWETSNPFENFYLSGKAAEISRMMMMQPGNNPDLLQIHMLHQFMLKAGDSAAVVEDLGRLEQVLSANNVPLPPSLASRWRLFKAVAWLRLGEQENCLHGHNAESCLFPIRGGGVHQLPRGSRGAMRALLEWLQHEPENLQARWLLNLAAMTLGEHPDAIPERWRIPADRFASAYPLPRYPDVAGALGVDVDDLAGGVVMDDFDRDGLLDLLVTGSGPESQIRVFRNEGDGRFTDRTAAAGLQGLTGGLHVVPADYNNDGWLDVLVLRTGWLRKEGHHPDSLLRNNGDFTFTDVTEEAGLLAFHPNQTAAWFDFDGDGWLDLFVGNESAADDRHPSALYRNNGDGTFRECAAESGINLAAYVKGVTAGDFNNDGRPDLYVSINGERNRLYRNDGAARDRKNGWRFTEVAETAGVAEPVMSFPCWFWDYDQDGWLDIMVFGYSIQNSGDIAADYLGLPHRAEKPRLYRNRGDGTFEDVTAAAGLDTVLHTMGCNYGDLDNDGWPDFYAGTGDPDFATLLPSRMFRNDAGRRFQDVTTAGGFGQLQKGHGVAFGDLDNDGDQDVYSVVGGVFEADHYPNQLFANPGNGNHRLTLELEGVKANRSAIGARIHVVVTLPDGETRTVHRVVGSGSSFGANPLRQEIGLGDATRIERVEIAWPGSGTVQVLDDLKIDHAYAVREGEAAREVTFTRFALPSAGTVTGHSHHH